MPHNSNQQDPETIQAVQTQAAQTQEQTQEQAPAETAAERFAEVGPLIQMGGRGVALKNMIQMLNDHRRRVFDGHKAQMKALGAEDKDVLEFQENAEEGDGEMNIVGEMKQEMPAELARAFMSMAETTRQAVQQNSDRDARRDAREDQSDKKKLGLPTKLAIGAGLALLTGGAGGLALMAPDIIKMLRVEPNKIEIPAIDQEEPPEWLRLMPPLSPEEVRRIERENT